MLSFNATVRQSAHNCMKCEQTAHSHPDALSGTAGAAQTHTAADKLQQLNPATSYKPSIPCPIQESRTSLASLSEGT